MKHIVTDFSRLVKFEHTIFALPFALIGFFLAITTTEVTFQWPLLAYVLLCMVTARNAAMGFNRYLDRKIDAANPRTVSREIPAGIISPQSALIFVISNALLFILTTWFINKLCFILSPVALLVILGYSYTKRFTPLCHFVLSTGLALAPLGAYMAVTGKFAMAPLLFSLLVFFWVSGFDIIYSCQDSNFDKSKGLKSVPVLIGVKNALIFSSFIHLLSIAIVILIAYVMNGDGLLIAGSVLFIVLMIYQHTIVKASNLSRVNLAFGTTNGVASVVYASFVILSFYL